MSDTWDQLQAHKRKHESLKERLAKRRKERQTALDLLNPTDDDQPEKSDSANLSSAADVKPTTKEAEEKTAIEGLYLIFQLL